MTTSCCDDDIRGQLITQEKARRMLSLNRKDFDVGEVLSPSKAAQTASPPTAPTSALQVRVVGTSDSVIGAPYCVGVVCGRWLVAVDVGVTARLRIVRQMRRLAAAREVARDVKLDEPDADLKLKTGEIYSLRAAADSLLMKQSRFRVDMRQDKATSEFIHTRLCITVVVVLVICPIPRILSNCLFVVCVHCCSCHMGVST